MTATERTGVSTTALAFIAGNSLSTKIMEKFWHRNYGQYGLSDTLFEAGDAKERILSEEKSLDPARLAAEITIAWLNNASSRVSADDIPGILRTMHAAVATLIPGADNSSVDEQVTQDFTPAVSVRRSLASKDHILSLIDGKPYKVLTRHLGRHGLTAAQYRQRYGLKSDYPMVAENYASKRREIAKLSGLGRIAKSAETAPPSADTPAPEPAAKAATRKTLRIATASAK